MAATNRKVQVTAQWQGKLRFKAAGSAGYPVELDATEGDGGESSGNSPLELMIMGLAGCMGIGVVKILERMRQPLQSLEVAAEGVRAEQIPNEVNEIRLTFAVTGEVAPSRIWRAVKLERDKYCPVAASMKAALQVHILLNGEPLEPPAEC